MLRACSSLGGQVLAFGLSLQIYEVTKSTLDLGMLGLIQFFPSVTLAIPAGHLVDRFAPGRVAMLVQMTNVVAAALLLLAGGSPAQLLIMVYVAALITGGTRAFEHPVNTSLLPSVVQQGDVARAVAWTTSVAKTATLVGPVVGGGLFALGPRICYGGAAFMFVAAAVIAAGLRSFGTPETAATLGLRDSFAGVTVVWRDRVLSGAMVLDMLAVLFGGAIALLPIFALDVLHTGSVGLGVLRAAPGLGAVSIGVWLTRRPVDRGAGKTLLATTALFGVLTCAFGLSREFMLTLSLLCAIGAADMVSIHIRSALVQLRTPPHMRGRVGAVNGIFISSSNQIGAFESGLTADWFGTVPAVVAGGLATIAVTIAVGMWFKPLRGVDHIRGPRSAQG